MQWFFVEGLLLLLLIPLFLLYLRFPLLESADSNAYETRWIEIFRHFQIFLKIWTCKLRGPGCIGLWSSAFFFLWSSRQWLCWRVSFSLRLFEGGSCVTLPISICQDHAKKSSYISSLRFLRRLLMNSLGWKTNLLQLFRPLPAGSLEFVTSAVDLFLRGWRVFVKFDFQ